MRLRQAVRRQREERVEADALRRKMKLIEEESRARQQLIAHADAVSRGEASRQLVGTTAAALATLENSMAMSDGNHAMAMSAPARVIEQHLLCPTCLEVFCDPCTIRCESSGESLRAGGRSLRADGAHCVSIHSAGSGRV